MKKGLWMTFVLIGIVFFAMVLIEKGSGCSNDYARITKIEYRAEVVDEQGSEGKVRITERLTFDIRAASKNNLFWELWRDLPEEYVDGVKVYYKVLSVKRLSVNGVPNELVFSEAKKLYWDDNDYVSTQDGLGPNRWFHSEGPYDEYNNFECVLFYVDGLYREEVVFELEYEMYNASLRYGDCSELYLSVYSGGTIKYLESLSASIAIPKDKMPSDGNYIAGTFGTKAHSFDFTESSDEDFVTFDFSLDRSQLKFKPYNEYVEFSLVSFGDDKHLFTEFASVNSRYNDKVFNQIVAAQDEYFALPEVYRTKKIVTLCVMIGIAGIIIGIVYLFDKSKRRNLKLFKPTVDYPLYREIPKELDVSLAASLVFCKHKVFDDVPDAYAATILSLSRKGYIETEKIDPKGDWKPSNVRAVIVAVQRPDVFASLASSPEGRPTMSHTEQQYYNLLCRHARRGAINLKDFQTKVAKDYQFTHQFLKNIKSTVRQMGVTEGYFATPTYKLHRHAMIGSIGALAVFGLLIMLIANYISFRSRLDLAFGAFFVLGGGMIAAALLLNYFSRKYILLTQLGEDEYSKWRGLYNFLNSETLMNERTVLDVAIWEDYLIYATAFGISKKVIKALNVRMPDFDMANSRIVGHPFLCRMTFVHFYSRSFRTSTRSATWYSRTGGWGGYGGGGRGGGGGGGGH